ncbi:ABC transporter permease [Pedosphaera parvula]|uniref:ABC-2 type transporter n=1 Tax=Pedosphaera parvula (strain Ellin514) TaxID=320771 RepID=B9XF36_PEDPL|nr:ABC transporter permease subunit [Pedosphaera parvula]EEF61534.1 ABC-2 type transporter [Pedosphaera parvula Ellin514]
MQAYLTLTRRELAGFFVSLTGYVIIAAAVFLMGLSFVALIGQLQSEATPVPLTQLFYSTHFFWLILVLATPMITMRLFAQEKYSGTFETLMTTPVSDLQVVMAKFSGALVFYMLMWLPLVGCMFILGHYTNNAKALDPGLIGSTYFGIFLLGGVFMSMGCFASALTRSQMIAAMMALTFGFTLFLLSFLASRLDMVTSWQTEALSHLALFDQMNDFARGLIDTRYVIFYVSLTVLFLFLTLRVVQSRRWK